jgi:hypothetical protein
MALFKTSFMLKICRKIVFVLYVYDDINSVCGILQTTVLKRQEVAGKVYFYA